MGGEVWVEEFEAFVQARSAALARAAYLLTGDRHRAEDLLQDTLAQVADRWPTPARAGDPEAYVRRVLYSRAVVAWRRRRWREVLHPGDLDSLAELRSPTDDSETVARRLVLRDALAQLTPRQRAVLVLRSYEDQRARYPFRPLTCDSATAGDSAPGRCPSYVRVSGAPSPARGCSCLPFTAICQVRRPAIAGPDGARARSATDRRPDSLLYREWPEPYKE